MSEANVRVEVKLIQAAHGAPSGFQPAIPLLIPG